MIVSVFIKWHEGDRSQYDTLLVSGRNIANCLHRALIKAEQRILDSSNAVVGSCRVDGYRVVEYDDEVPVSHETIQAI